MEKNPFFINNDMNPSSPMSHDNYATKETRYCFDAIFKKLDRDVAKAI